jgi:DNA-directed RNA polymerase omega subunit
MTNINDENNQEIIENKFEKCLVASKRAKEILSGAPTNHDKSVKSPIISLAEIAAGELNIEQIKKNIAAGDNIYQPEIIEPVESEENAKSKAKESLFVNENLDVID